MKEGATMNECAAPELGPILRYKQFLFDRIPSLEEAFPDSSGVGSSDDRERRKLREFESHKFEYFTLFYSLIFLYHCLLAACLLTACFLVH